MTSIFELEAKEQEEFDREYADWLKQFETNYIVERNEEEEND